MIKHILFNIYHQNNKTNTPMEVLLDSDRGWKTAMVSLCSGLLRENEHKKIYFRNYFIETNQFDKFVLFQNNCYDDLIQPDWSELLKTTADLAGDIRFFVYALGGYFYDNHLHTQPYKVPINSEIFTIPGGKEVAIFLAENLIDDRFVVDIYTSYYYKYGDEEDYFEEYRENHMNEFFDLCHSIGMSVRD